MASCCNAAVGVARNDAKHKLECHCLLATSLKAPSLGDGPSNPQPIHPASLNPIRSEALRYDFIPTASWCCPPWLPSCTAPRLSFHFECVCGVWLAGPGSLLSRRHRSSHHRTPDCAASQTLRSTHRELQQKRRSFLALDCRFLM